MNARKSVQERADEVKARRDGEIAIATEFVPGAWFPDDQHGYSIALCACDGGPYLGARQMGTPCVCERCRRITPDQWNFLVGAARADERERITKAVEAVLGIHDRGEVHPSLTADAVAQAVRWTLRDYPPGLPGGEHQ